MNPKIKKIDVEYQKNAEKIVELQKRQKELEEQRTHLENMEIIGLVRHVGITPDQLAAILQPKKAEKPLSADQPAHPEEHRTEKKVEYEQNEP